ncbi:hypothetical protein [Streptomyces sp. NBC_00989]|uniref:hypothetical protein n=1 Tax=Streptomyces sp. NBC_00989 TaxID=2903705 RepID=UPI003870B370|nr:hypothetical protein OG714_54960 [Streptomyces sp. NBC_00989]
MRQRLATRWHAPGRPDSWPRARLQEIRDVPSAGWRHIATWIRTVIVLTALTAITLLGWWSINALIALQPWTALGDTGLLATVIHPVHGYLTAHTRDLPVDAQMAYRTWEVVGGATFLTSTIFKATCARLTWTAWGAATTAMVWIASPASGRPVATVLMVLGWTVASALALRGLSLRPQFTTHVHNDPQIRVNIHTPAPVVKRVEINGRELRSVE